MTLSYYLDSKSGKIVAFDYWNTNSQFKRIIYLNEDYFDPDNIFEHSQCWTRFGPRKWHATDDDIILRIYRQGGIDRVREYILCSITTSLAFENL